jgi:predicted glycosyltransferase
MKRVTILVTHLLGTGHLTRSLLLARALVDAGLTPQVISGGMPVRHLDLSGIDFVQLPPVRSDGASFTRLLDDMQRPVEAALLQHRIAFLTSALLAAPPDVLITELFPFGRRVLREEFLAALSTAAALPSPPLVFASVRDILSPPSSLKKARQTEAWLSAYYDGVLVHSDAHVIPLEASWPVTPEVAAMLTYTGYIAPDCPTLDPQDREGRDEVIVTAGGGSVGRKLFETAIDAARMGTRRWRLLVGGTDAVEVCAALNAKADGTAARAEPLRSDYRAMLTRCAAAVGQCGYNTAIDWLQAGVAGVFVPFAEAGEVEQSVRAASLQSRYGYGCIAEEELSPAGLAAAVDAAVSKGRLGADDLNFQGAAQTARYLVNRLEKRA